MSTLDNTTDDLFSDKTGIYNVDSLLYTIQKDESQFNEIINANAFFKEITNVSIRSDSKIAVDTLASVSLLDPAFTIIPQSPIPESINTSEFTKFKGSADQEYISFMISKGQNDMPVTIILDEITKNIPQSSQSGADVDTMTRNHKHMDEYMRSIINATCKTYYIRSMDILRNDQSATNTREPWNESLFTFTNQTITKRDTLHEVVSDTAYDVLCDIVKAKAIKNLDFNALSTTYENKRKYIEPDFLKDLQDGRFKGSLYSRLRFDMINRLKLPNGTINSKNNNVILYFKMFAVDLYLKTCYPVLAYDYIKCMMNLYISYGDFINSRIALLAKVMFTYYFIQRIVKNYTVGSQVKAYSELLTGIVTRLDWYIQHINQIDMTGKKTDMLKTIARDLHTTSNTVVDKNTQVQKLKKEITNNQLAMRNVIFNTSELKKQYTSKLIEVFILVFILIILITICSIMLFLATDQNKMQLYVLYIAGGIAIVILIYQITKMISKMIASGKKSS